MAEMNDAVKRKEPEPVTEEKKEEPKTAEAPKIAVAVKAAASSNEPDAKRLKGTPADASVVRKQLEYYMSDDNLKNDTFFQGKIKGNSEGWLEIDCILQCNKMKAMKTTREEVVAALKTGSKIEIKEDGLSIRRPANLALPPLVERPQHHQKKSVAHAHDGGVIAIIKDIPAEQSWMQINDKLRGKLTDKVQLWFVSEVSDKSTCIVAIAPFDDDLKFFETMEFEAGGKNLKVDVAYGDVLQNALKVMPKHIRDKREKEVRKRQKERNRPIVVGSQRFVNVNALRGRVKEIINSRSDGESLKVDGSDFKLIKALLNFHPKGDTKSVGLVGIKVQKSSKGENRCFWMVKENGDAEDFSAQKCLGAIEANPPYVEADSKKPDAASPAPAASAAAAEEKKEEKKEEAPVAEKKEEEKKEEKKEEAKPA